MSPLNKTNFTKKMITAVGWYAAFFFLLVLFAFHEELNRWFLMVLGIFSPVILGLVFAYILNPIFRFFESRIFLRIYPHSLRRVLALLCTYFSFLLFIALLILMIVPQLIEAISSFIRDYQMHVDNAIGGINHLLGVLNSFFEKTIGKEDFFSPIKEAQLFDKLYALLSGYLETIDLEFITSAAGSFFSVLTDIIFALFISLYFLVSKEKRYAQIMKFRNAVFDDRINKNITRLCTTVDNLFGKFFEGRIIDSLIVGVFLYLFFQLFGIPYAIILATFIAITNIIPYVGFFIGAIPSLLIVLLTNYEKAIPFIVLALIVFYFENNIISPKILGNNTGLSPLCVIIAICVTGAMFGFVGMLIGVPLFATILDFGNSLVRTRLQRKRLPDDVENYYAPDLIIDPMEMNAGRAKNMLVRLEKRVLHIQKVIATEGDAGLKRSDRFALSLYRVARKIRLFSEPTPELLTRFSTEDAKKAIKKTAKRSVAEYRTEALISIRKKEERA